MITLVCGGRTFADFEFLCRSLDSLNPAPTIIITGSQRARLMRDLAYVGADYLAEEWARLREIPYIGIPAKWKTGTLGQMEGFARNRLMMNLFEIGLPVRPERVVAFPGYHGTQNMMLIAQQHGIKPVTFGW